MFIPTETLSQDRLRIGAEFVTGFEPLQGNAGITHGGVLHDDAAREYAYGPARGLPDSKFGTFTAALDDETKKNGWTVISMKNDWKRIFAFDQ